VSTALGIGLGGLGVFSRLAATRGLDLDFAKGVYALNGPRLPTFPAGWSFSRTDTNGTATALDLAGNVIQFATGVPRITNRGILVEEARTNSLRNSVAAGAVAGTPGTLPTNWLELSLAAGISREVVGAGTEDGLTYVDMRFFGTASTSPAVQLNFEQVGVVAASAAQVWTTSCFTKLVAGSLTDIAAVTLRLYPRTAVPAELPGVVSSDLKSEITAARARISAALTTPASTATVNTGLAFSITGTKTLDFTIRLYSPQLEAGAFATSPIITTGAAGTRGADAPRLTVVGGEKTVIVEGIAPTTLTATLRCLASLTTADFATYVVAGFTSTGTVQLFRKSSIGNTTLGVTSNVVTAGAPFKFAFTFGTDGTDASCLNGGTPVTNTGLAGVYTFTELRPGWWAGDPGPFNAYDGRIRVFDRRVTAAELQALTAP
jgi:hypothetical protein